METGVSLSLDPEYSLTSSMEDLRLRPSTKRLLFDSSEPQRSASEDIEHVLNIAVDPPPEFQDHPSAEVESVKSACEEPTHLINPNDSGLLEKHGKNDHIRRYLSSLNERMVVEQWPDSQIESAENEYDVIPNQSLKKEHSGGFVMQSAVNHHLSTAKGQKSSDSFADKTASSLSRPLTEDMLLELELEQYEQMKRRLLDEHHESLQRLLAQQERELVELWTRLSTSGSGFHTSAVLSGRTVPGVQQNGSLYGVNCSQESVSVIKRSSLDTDSVVRNGSAVPVEAGGNGIISERCLTTPPVDCYQSFDSFKAKSPAGVYYRDQLVTSPVPSCSTGVTDDTGSEFAFKSPAVLTSRRRVIPMDSLLSTEKELPSTGHSILMHSSVSQMTTPNTSQKSTPPHVTFASPSLVNNFSASHDHRSQRRYVDPHFEVCEHGSRITSQNGS